MAAGPASVTGEFSGTLSLSYHLTDDLMVFGGYSRGYKAGGYNTDRSGFQMTPATLTSAQLNVNQIAFDPEFTDAFEVGFKSTILGGSTTFNVTGFYQQIADYQLNAFNGFNFITRNIPDVISQGAEIEFNSRPTDNLMVNLGVVYTDAYFDSTVSFNPLTASLPNDPNTVRSGEPLAFSAEWVVTGGIGYTQPIGDNLQLSAYVDGRWSGEYQTQTLAQRDHRSGRLRGVQRSPRRRRAGRALVGGILGSEPDRRILLCQRLLPAIAGRHAGDLPLHAADLRRHAARAIKRSAQPSKSGGRGESSGRLLSGVCFCFTGARQRGAMALSVLIVDDHAPIARCWPRCSARARAMVRQAASGQEALALYDAAAADLVLADQTMPGTEGVALIAALRARAGAARLILVSGHKSAELYARAREAGADAVLVKPVSPRALMETVNALFSDGASPHAP